MTVQKKLTEAKIANVDYEKPHPNTKKDIASKAKILELFLTNKTFKQTDMEKATNLSYVTIIKQLKQLAKNNLISIIGYERTSAGGLQKNIWALTDMGLFWVLQHVLYEDLEKVISAYQDKLLIFRKLPLFEKAGLLNLLLARMHIAFFTLKGQRIVEEHNFNAHYYDYSEKYGAYDVFTEKESAEGVTLNILMPLIKYSHGEDDCTPLLFMKVCQDDPELKLLIEKQISKEKAEAEANLREIKCLNHVWNKTDFDWLQNELETIVRSVVTTGFVTAHRK
jgi:DNA-binding PadR family transcriptional regulator